MAAIKINQNMKIMSQPNRQHQKDIWRPADDLEDILMTQLTSQEPNSQLLFDFISHSGVRPCPPVNTSED